MTADVTLARDISTFTDPATESKVTEGAHGSRIQFIRNGNSHDYFLSHSDGALVARHAGNKKFANLRSLLASAEFANIRGFASTQVRMFKDLEVEKLIPPEGDLDGKRLALQTLQRALVPRVQTETEPVIRVLLLDGPAGVGKTSLIQRLLVQRARAQQESGAAPPILHVTSRGRRLTALDEALAQSIQILRAQFTFDQVPVLVRHNLLQIAIDGFDELVDPEGYKDAWFALQDFFSSTKFGGPIILAGRDTFFDEQSFKEQMKESKTRFTLSHARLESVSVSTAKQWLALNGWKQADLDDNYSNLIFRPGSYTLRPFFLNELVLARSWDAIESYDLTPRSYLVDKFVTREATLIGDQLSLSVSDIKGRLVNVFEEVSVEMADNETDAVDLSFLQMVTEFAFVDSLSSTDVAKLRHKAGSFALLVSDAREGYRRFPHTEISHHFLALALIRLIASGASVRFLRRGIVTSDLLEIFAELFSSVPQEVADKFVRSLETLLSQEATFDRLPDNAASLLITSLCRNTHESVRKFADLQVSNAVLFGLVAPSRLERVRIQRLDAQEASLEHVQFHDCEVVNLMADETTRFGATSPKVHQIQLKTDKGLLRGMYDPTEIEAWIATRSASSVKPVSNEDAMRLLDRVCRIMLRQHRIKDHESDEAGRVLQDKYWPHVEKILTDASLLDRVRGKQMSGVHAPFVQLRDPYNLLAHKSNAKVAAIWAKVGAIPK